MGLASLPAGAPYADRDQIPESLLFYDRSTTRAASPLSHPVTLLHRLLNREEFQSCGLTFALYQTGILLRLFAHS